MKNSTHFFLFTHLQLLNDLADLIKENPQNTREINKLEKRLDGVNKDDLKSKGEAALSKLNPTERTK